MRTPSISCVMPTTAARRWCIPHAIRYFQQQTFRDAELVIVDDGVGVANVLQSSALDQRIRYVHLPTTPPLSQKYNLCVEHAQADWIALWADDDWHAPWRLAYSMAVARQHHSTEIVGLRHMIFHKMGTSRSWLYDRRHDHHPYFLGGSILFHRVYWLRHKFAADHTQNADSSFTNDIGAEEYRRVATVLYDERFYVAMNHDDNTGRKLDPSPGMGWSIYDGDVRRMLGDDAKLYVP